VTDVLILQHTAPETPGTLGEALAKRGLLTHTVRPFAGDRVPEVLADAAGLVVLGGPMGVYETEAHPHLRGELALIEEALRAGVPVLGVCLGSQLIATVLGADVQPAPAKEIGWHGVALTDEAARDPLWRSKDDRDDRLPRRFPAFHWHGDAFEVPAGATRLAWSAQTGCQAFRYGAPEAGAYGLLFHLEVTAPIVRGMTVAFAGELRAEGLDGAALREQAAAHLPVLQQIGRRVFGRWAGRVEARTTRTA
jgi:GMP synthase (glutamine-hydrolysing)